jgi:starch synthase
MNILFAAAECAPLAKVGGLGDVVGSLPKALRQIGVDVRVILPMYKNISASTTPAAEIKKIQVTFGGRKISVIIRQTTLTQSDVVVYLLEEPGIFGSGGIYETAGATPGTETEIKKFLFFSECVAEFLKQKNWQIDLLHVHDWHLAIAPLLVKLRKLPIPVLLTIHNLAMQGLAEPASLEALGNKISLQPSMQEDLEKYGKINLLRQGILHADCVSTVSQSYAREITTQKFGEGLDSDLRQLPKIFGILNGIDQTVWDPNSDKLLTKNFNKSNFEPKPENKSALQKLLGLKPDVCVPLIGIVSRLTGQKGFDLLESIWTELETLDFQMVVLGLGESQIENFFANLCQKYPQRFILHKKFDELLAHQIYAASDMFLMPSRFEPCGLGQMIAMRYGSIPIVRAVGGLKDSVINLTDNLNNTNSATGFVFADYSSAALLSEIERAIKIYRQNQRAWSRMRQNAMAKDFSWTASAEKYRKLYQQIINL